MQELTLCFVLYDLHLPNASLLPLADIKAVQLGSLAKEGCPLLLSYTGGKKSFFLSKKKKKKKRKRRGNKDERKKNVNSMKTQCLILL